MTAQLNAFTTIQKCAALQHLTLESEEWVAFTTMWKCAVLQPQAMALQTTTKL